MKHNPKHQTRMATRTQTRPPPDLVDESKWVAVRQNLVHILQCQHGAHVLEGGLCVTGASQ